MRLGSAIMLVVLLPSMLAFVNVKLVKATGTIYIKADGSVDPPDAPVQRAGNIYTLKGNITTDADGILIERDNITLDGGGYTLQGAPGWPFQNGTRILKSINVTIQNMRIENFANGIVLDNSSHCMILDNVLMSNGAGVWLAYSSNNTIRANCATDHHAAAIYLWPASTDNNILENNLTNDYFGIMAYGSRNSFCRNNISNCWYGIDLAYGLNNTISNNTFSSAGLSVFSCFRNTVEQNIVNGKPLVYLEEMSNYTVGDAGQVILVNCDSIRVNGLNLSDTMYGLELWGTNNSRVTQNTMRANKWGGIYLWSSFGNIFEKNNITGNLYHGIHFYASSNNLLKNNTMADNSIFGFFIDGSELSHFIHNIDVSNTIEGKPIYYWINQTDRTVPSDAGCVALVNCTRMIVQNLTISRNAQAITLAFTANSTITQNNVTMNEYGISLIESSGNLISQNNITKDWNGILLRSSSNNTIQENQIAWSNYHGLVAFSSSQNIIVRNSFAKDWYGIWLESSSNNWIYHNHFIDNTNQLFTRGSVNVWDNGYPSGGNHWSNYNGTDRYGGQYQNLTGSDGIGDTPYAIDANNNDRYPLRTHDVATTSVKPSKSIVGQGDPVSICVTAENHGYSSESFNVTVYADSIVIAFAGVTLAEGKSTIITFIWNTTDSARGDYIISTAADAVPGETQIGDNHFTGDEIRVGISGDMNGDELVDLKDVYTVGRAFGSARNETDGSYWHTPCHSCCPHSPNCDLNDDGKIDLRDYYATCKNFGKSW